VPILNERQWQLLLHIGASIVPEVTGLDAEGQRRFRELVGGALAQRPRSMQRQFALFLGVLHWLPALRFGRSFDRLGARQRDAVLRWLLDAPVMRLRSGFWGLRTLVFMGVYGQPQSWPAIGYRPSFDGNQHLHA
jgi:hypothetical protein